MSIFSYFQRCVESYEYVSLPTAVDASEVSKYGAYAWLRGMIFAPISAEGESKSIKYWK